MKNYQKYFIVDQKKKENIKMTLMNEKLKLLSCSEFRNFLKKMIEDKIEKEWTPDFIENLNLVMVPRMTIKRRYENKGIDLIKLIASNFRFSVNLKVLIIFSHSSFVISVFKFNLVVVILSGLFFATSSISIPP